MTGRKGDKSGNSKRRKALFFFSFSEQLLKSMTCERKLTTGKEGLH